MNAMPLRGALSGIVAGDFSDPTNERIIYLSAAGLGVLGLGLLFGTLVWWRRGRQEHPALAPLEVMSARAWEKAPEGDRRRRLEQVRLAGAAASLDERRGSDPVDLEALVRSVPNSFDDLKEPSAVVDAPDAVADPDEVAAEGALAADADVAVEESAAEEVAANEVASAGEETAVEAVEPAAPEAPAVVDPKAVAPPAKPDVDATSISTERPVVSPEPAPETSKEAPKDPPKDLTK